MKFYLFTHCISVIHAHVSSIMLQVNLKIYPCSYIHYSISTIHGHVSSIILHTWQHKIQSDIFVHLQYYAKSSFQYYGITSKHEIPSVPTCHQYSLRLHLKLFYMISWNCNCLFTVHLKHGHLFMLLHGNMTHYSLSKLFHG